MVKAWGSHMSNGEEAVSGGKILEITKTVVDSNNTK